ncbi:MAG: DNA-processing protein DprA [Clostridia bacterium]|nr:DNA-processing protein DprA [Clostridia bacterium]
MDSRLYWIWLQQVLPAGSRAVSDLLDIYGHARTVYNATPDEYKNAGLSDDLCRRLADKSLNKAHRILDRVLELGDWMLTPEDALYPLCLRHCGAPPAVLYARGVMPDLDSTPAVAVVGTRHATREGLLEARALAAGLAAGGVVVVSGGATGIDAAVHAGALDGGGITIVVMACPLNVDYPAENADLRCRVVASGGLLLSEFPPDEEYKCDFHIRNRIMAGLSQGVCLAQTPGRSGARITARLGREYNREVFALPGTLSGHRYDGAHKEIQGGATLVIRATDILREYAPMYPGVLDLEAAEAAQRLAEGQPLPKVEETPKIEKPKREKAKKTKRLSRRKQVEAEIPPAAIPVAAAAACPDGASEAAKRVCEVLTSEPQPVDLLAEKTGMPIPTLLAALTELEMFGCAANSAGQQYKRT